MSPGPKPKDERPLITHCYWHNAKDPQANQVYRAETMIQMLNMIGQPLRSISEAQAFVDWLTATPYWLRNSVPHRGRSSFTVRRTINREGLSYAYPHNGHIALLRRDYHTFPLAHELAHHMVPGDVSAAHGWQFAAAMVSLIRFVYGHDAARLLRWMYHAGSIRTRPVVGGRHSLEPIPA